MINNDKFYYSEKQQDTKLLKLLCAASFLLAGTVTYLICKDSKNQEQAPLEEHNEIKENNLSIIDNSLTEPINLKTYFEREEQIYYRENTKVLYKDKTYLLKDLYKLSNEENTYICYLDKETYYYYDIDTDCAIAIKDYEDLSSLKVEQLLYSFPYQSKYGTKEESIILEDDFINEVEDIDLINRSSLVKEKERKSE